MTNLDSRRFGAGGGGGDWSGFSAPRVATSVASHVRAYVYDIERILDSAWVKPLVPKEQGRIGAVTFRQEFLSASAALFFLRFDDGFDCKLVSKKQVIRPNASAEEREGFPEYYARSSAVQRYFPRLLHSFFTHSKTGWENRVLLFEYVEGIDSASRDGSVEFRRLLQQPFRFQQLVHGLYQAVRDLGKAGFRLFDVQPADGHNLRFVPQIERFLLIDSDKIDRVKLDLPMCMLDFVDSSFVWGSQRQDPLALEIAIHLLKLFEQESPGKLLAQAPLRHGEKYEPLLVGQEREIPEAELVLPDTTAAFVAYRDAFGRYPKGTEGTGLYFRRVSPGYEFSVDKILVEAALRSDLQLFGERLRANEGVGTDRRL
ncbi:MAG: hypothetical protein K1X83_00500 [Oligoflexia bacterium]|nr:hypothetical protein [Oligoflexia bacterium]